MQEQFLQKVDNYEIKFCKPILAHTGLDIFSGQMVMPYWTWDLHCPKSGMGTMTLQRFIKHGKIPLL
jgi:hypothetical protein